MLTLDVVIRLPILVALECTLSFVLARTEPLIGDVISWILLTPVVILALALVVIDSRTLVGVYLTAVSVTCVFLTYHSALLFHLSNEKKSVLHYSTFILASLLLAASYSFNPFLSNVSNDELSTVLYYQYFPFLVLPAFVSTDLNSTVGAIYKFFLLAIPLWIIFLAVYRVMPSTIHNLHILYRSLTRMGLEIVLEYIFFVRAKDIVPSLLRWYSVFHLVYFTCLRYEPSGSFSQLGEIVIASVCNSWVSVVASSFSIAYLARVLDGLLLFLLDGAAGGEGEEDFQLFCGMIHVILALQSGITSLEGSEQYARFMRNLVIMSVGIVHTSHVMTLPAVESLCASQSNNRGKHLKILVLFTMQLTVPSIIIYSIGSAVFEFNTWTFALFTFSAEIVFKVSVTIITYLIFFIWDFVSPRSSENYFDDVLRQIKILSGCVVFCFGIVLFLNGLYIFAFESGGKVRAVMLSIHAYSNIFVQCKEGWRSFSLRRTASKKLSLLETIKMEEIPEESRDVCPICFRDISVAIKTQCGHLFHKSCLRKWIYIEDFCPMCKTPLLSNSQSESQDSENRADNLN